MSKLKVSMIAALTCLMVSIVFAQSFFSTGSDSNSTAKTPSADDMKNRVRDLGKQNEAKLNQQVQDLLAKNPPPPLPPLGTPNTKQGATTPSAPSAGTPTNNNAAANTATTEPAAESAQSTESAPAAQEASPSQGYTGFQSDDATTNTKKPEKKTQSDDGWNVKY